MESTLFHRLLHFMLSNTGAPFYYNGLSKAVKSNENTIRNYLMYAAQSYVVADLTNFSFSLKEDVRSQHKFYCIDNGLMNAPTFRFSPRSGTLLENAVYNELVNQGFEQISFARQKNECDFIALKNNEYHAFQVCYDLNSENESREIAGFDNLDKNLRLVSKTVVTYDRETQLNDVRVIPLWQLGLEAERSCEAVKL